jgi:hypothetical protein
MKTMADAIKAIIADQASEGAVARMVKLAYYMGRAEAAREVCDAHSAIMRTSRAAARAMRYHNMAERALPLDDKIYHPDYSGDYVYCFGDDEAPLAVSRHGA